MSKLVQKYRILVQVRTDLTEEEIASRATRPKMSNECGWPYRDTGEIIHARRRSIACAFYRALKQIAPIIKIRAVRLPVASLGLGASYKPDAVALRAWRGFACLCGSVNGVEDEVKHFASRVHHPHTFMTACGIPFTTYWTVNGKPECDKCLEVAVEQHPEMKQYL